MALERDAAEARAALLEEERRYRESLHWCRCARPLPCRKYLGWAACRICERAIHHPDHARRPR